MGPFDGGTPDVDAMVESGDLELRFEVGEGEDFSPEEAELRVGMARAQSDRSETEEPQWVDVGAVTLEPPTTLEASALPATYGGLHFALDLAEPCQASFVVAAGDAGDVEICLSGLPPTDLRCPSPSLLSAGEMVRLQAQLDVDVLLEPLASASLEEGARVDATEEPALHAEIVGRWQDAWSAECGVPSP